MGYYKIKSHAGTGKLLNIAASGPISGRKNTNIWDESCPIDQTWSIASLGNNQQVKIINNLSYMLNANTSTWNCDVYTSNSDTYVNFEKVSTGVYYIRLKSHPERYLTAGGTKSGSDVSWEKLSTTTAGKKAQQWKVTATSLPTVYTRVTSGADSLGDDQMETNAEYIYNNQSKYGTSETLTASQFKVSNKSADILARISVDTMSGPEFRNKRACCKRKEVV